MSQAEPTFAWRDRTKTRHIIFHDSHTDPALKSTTAFLRTRGRVMGLLEVGYHFVIERDGRVVGTRPHSTIGSHCLGHNHDSVGVCMAGGLCGADDFTADQMHSAASLVSFLRDQYGEHVKVVGHAEVASYRMRSRDCSCPAFDMSVFRKDHMTTTATSAYPPPTPDTDPKKLSTQNQLLLDYLTSGRSLSNMIALMSLGIGSLSSRIAELRKHLKATDAPHEIAGKEKRDIHERHYMSYSLVERKTDDAVVG